MVCNGRSIRFPSVLRRRYRALHCRNVKSSALSQRVSKIAPGTWVGGKKECIAGDEHHKGIPTPIPGQGFTCALEVMKPENEDAPANPARLPGEVDIDGVVVVVV